MDRVYADYNATSPLRPEAKAALLGALEELGNPSSVHAHGREARKHIEGARQAILDSIGLPDYRLAFTSGATEGLATLLAPGTKPVTASTQSTHLMIAATDHVAALQGHRFAPDTTTLLPVTDDGLIDLENLEASLARDNDGSVIVCVHGANNETGVMQPLAEIAALCADHGALFVCDLVQWIGREPLADMRPDAIVLSGHKLGSPAGIGAIIYDPQRMQIATPLIRGGGQERGVRAGTENAIGILGFAAALEAAVKARPDEQKRIGALRDRFEQSLLEQHPGAVIFGASAPRLSNTSCFAISGQESALALMQLDLDGISLSSGSACSSGKVKQSHVLEAMNVAPELASCALRLSLGFGSTDADVDRTLASISRWSGSQ